MMRRILLLMLLALPLHAAHITDKLVVGLYEAEKLTGEPRQLLTSGTPIEVLQRGKGVVEVRLADGTTGWVESGYVTEEKPARMMLLEAQAELRRLKAEGSGAAGGEGLAPELPSVREARLQQQLDEANARIERMEAGQAELLAARMAQHKLEKLQQRVAKARELLGDSSPEAQQVLGGEEQGLFQRYLPWVLAASGLLIGFAAGVGFVDYRIRKRYGGFRI